MKRFFAFFAGVLVLLTACSSNKSSPPMEIDSFRLLQTVEFSQHISKAYYHPIAKAVYAMDPETHQILIRKDGKAANIIGGMGSGDSSFMTLADFTLNSDGSIYALDGSAQLIKRFNADGKFISSMELSYVQQPSKMALGTQQTVYIFDTATSEIVAFNLLDGSELFRFGRFVLQRVDQLFANRDYVVAYDKSKDQSLLFSSLGQHISNDTGQIVYDVYNNAISLTNEALVSKMSAAWLPLTGTARSMTIAKDTLVIVVDRQVRLLKLDYAPVL
jgi:hypothetical protein